MAAPITQGVSLHPLASRDGTQSSTFVSLQTPIPSEPHSAPTPTPTKKNTHSRSQTERRAALPHQTRHKTSASEHCHPDKTDAAANQLEPQEWGLIHHDLEAYPIILESDVAKAAQVSSAASPTGPSTASAPVSPISAPGVPPIRLLSAEQFAQIHRQHADADVPHHVVFPFLHGVDGDNVAQNIFFGAPVEGMPSPQYRGLTVVRADMPVPGAPVYPSSRKRASSSASKLSRYAMANRSRADSLATTASSFYAGSDDGTAVTTPTGTDMSSQPWAESSSSISSATSSHMSSNSLFSVSTGDMDMSSRASTSFGGNDSGSKHRQRFETYDSQPKHSILNATIFPAELLHPPPALVAELLTSSPSSTGYTRSPPHVGGDVEGATFLTPRQASGVSLRNFRIQCVKYATISDIVIYCPAGLHEGVVELADWFRQAQQAWWEERCERKLGGLRYNVFIVHDSFDTFERNFPHLVAVDGSGFSRNRIDFIEREREEMQRLTACSEIDENVWLGCSADVPSVDMSEDRANSTASLESSLPEESNPNAFSICINAYDGAEMPTSARLAHASHYLDAVEATALFELNSQAALRELEEDDDGVMSITADDRATLSLGPQGWSPSLGSPKKKSAAPSQSASPKSSSLSGASLVSGSGRTTRLVPNADNIVHLDCASTVQNCGTDQATNALIDDIIALCIWIKSQTCPKKQPAPFSVPSSTQPQHSILHGALRGVGYNRTSSSNQQGAQPSESPARSQRSSTSSSSSGNAHQPVSRRVLIHCGDGYTETSIFALAYLMFSRQLSLPEAYLDLQGRANRSFFVYAKDLPFLKKLEQRIKADFKPAAVPIRSDRSSSSSTSHAHDSTAQNSEQPSQTMRLKSRHSFWMQSSANSSSDDRIGEEREKGGTTRRILGRGTSTSRRRSSSSSMDSSRHEASSDTKPVVEQTLWARGIAAASGLVSAASQGSKDGKRVPTLSGPAASTPSAPVQMPSRANTPTPQSSAAGSASGVNSTAIAASHGWFTHERFEGSLPSRILPFLYLGNLNHAINADMLHALGITHVVSVGETALNPPPASSISSVGLTKYASGDVEPASPSQLPAPAASSNSLWAEHRAGRISVLDLKNVSDDGIDPLRSAMTNAVEYIERARREGGKVLVHCRVGVSRSSTIVLAYAMAHLDLSLVESYLLVRSRRLNILIQPHLLFFWELRGWETYLVRLKAARARAAIEASRSKVSSHRASHDHDVVMAEAPLAREQGTNRLHTHLASSMDALDLSDSKDSVPFSHLGLGSNNPNAAYLYGDSSHPGTPSDMSITTSSRSSVSAEGGSVGMDSAMENAPDLASLAPLDVDLGAGAGSPYGFEVPGVEKLPFGTGSVAGLPAESLRLPWGFLAREITSLNARYLID